MGCGADGARDVPELGADGSAQGGRGGTALAYEPAVLSD